MRIIIITAFVLLSGCSFISYEGKPDGSTTAYGIDIGTNQALAGFSASTDGKNRSIKLDSLNANKTEGLKQINQGLSLLIEGVAKGIK